NLEEAHNKLIPASYHYRIVRRDGTVRYVYTITRFNFNAKGETVSLYGVTYDETESKIAEIQLAEYTDNLLKIKNQLEYSEFKLKQAQAIARVGSWERNYKDNSIIWSDENCRIYGVSLQENKQTFESWKSFVHSEDLENTLQILENAHKTLTPATLYYRIVRKDGAVRYVYTITQFTYNETGKAVSLYGVTLDVTEQKLTELEILKKNEELRNLSNHIQHVREEERKLVSRDLHDELGQQLTALKMEINWIISNATGADEEMVLRLKQVLQFSDDLISTIRRILADLRPAIIDDLGLVAALEWKCDDFMEKSGVECKFISSIDERVFRDDFSINVYRILQEALTNVIRYAEAKLVTVIVHEDKQNLFLEISDDGKGFCTESIKNGKTLGILGMKERAALFDGDLEVIGMPNKGTSIKLKIPLI
ncbi:MAG TPA: PAS domain-containing protein, partial [Bacteroidia bacterium]|nr:PAS domain-containing protein [Bacteroidia bacterium]